MSGRFNMNKLVQESEEVRKWRAEASVVMDRLAKKHAAKPVRGRTNV